MNFLSFIEIIATLTSLGYLILLIRQIKWCWPMSIVSALLSIYLFFESKLYAESVLYGYFIIISIYGWWNWSKPRVSNGISTWKLGYHVITVIVGALLSFGVGHLFITYTDADKPYFDAATSVFSIIASILEARKILSGWIYWIIINGLTAGLYFSKSLNIYGALMVVYFVMSVVGYIAWQRKNEEVSS